MARRPKTDTATPPETVPGQDQANGSMLANPSEQFMEQIREAVAELENIDERRAKLSADRSAVLEGLAAEHGVNKHAMLAAIRYADLKDAAKQNWDLTYQVTRKALGVPIQMDLFEAQLERGTKQAVAAQQRRQASVDPNSLFVN